MFSVVIPLYNKEISIYNTIQSVLNQTFCDFEILVINDGCTDRSIEVVRSFEDSRIKIINKTNEGVSSARNRGIKEASYEWIAFLDGDDLWDNEHLMEYRRIVLNNPDLNWVFSGFRTIKYSHNDRLYLYKEGGRLTNVFDHLLQGIAIHTSTVCIKKNLFVLYEDLNFRVGMDSSEDREVWYKLCCIDKSPFYIDKPLSSYNLTAENSLSRNVHNIKKDHFLTMLNRIKQFEAYENLSPEDSLKFERFLEIANERMLMWRYVDGYFKNEYKTYFGKLGYLLMKVTSRYPKLLKRIVRKSYFLIR